MRDAFQNGAPPDERGPNPISKVVHPFYPAVAKVGCGREADANKGYKIKSIRIWSLSVVRNCLNDGVLFREVTLPDPYSDGR